MELKLRKTWTSLNWGMFFGKCSVNITNLNLTALRCYVEFVFAGGRRSIITKVNFFAVAKALFVVFKVNVIIWSLTVSELVQQHGPQSILGLDIY